MSSKVKTKFLKKRCGETQSFFFEKDNPKILLYPLTTMKIVIPSYERHDSFLTLSHLEKLDCEIYLFIIEEEYDDYKKYEDKCKIVFGPQGIGLMRNFITDYFDEGEVLVCMDDDIDHFYQDLSIELPKAIEYLSQSNLGLMTFPPTNMHLDRTRGYKEGFYYGIGTFHILKNHKEFQLRYNQGDDLQRSIYYLEKDGATIRNFNIYFKSKPMNGKWKPKGGFQRDIANYINETNRLAYEYRNYICLKDKYIKHFDCKVGNLTLSKKNPLVVELGYFNDFDKLYGLFEKIKLRIKANRNNRLGFPCSRRGIFGLSRPRFKYKGYLEKSYESKKYPEIHQELMRIGKIICPFSFNCIQVNHNTICPSHKDGNNVGDSLLVSFGDYEGCKIIVDKKEYDAKNKPIVFNGSQLEHYNTDDLVGTKYSLIFFTLPNR